jgi:tetratricopeptide (TPR) repeat protein
MRKILLILGMVVFGTGGMALADCPAPADTSTQLRDLIARAQTAENSTQGEQLSNRMWQVWLQAPDSAAQAALDAGMRRREVYDFAGAIREFDRLAEYCPLYAEGFNQRAYIHFMNGNHEKALIDLDVALSLQPLHVAAQSGRALTLMNLGRIAEARAQMLLAVENNPWLSEAALLADGAPLGRADKEL